MASYWQKAKREAKKRAYYCGYCWVYHNPTSDWKNPYLFYESMVDVLPPWVPKNATRFGDGPESVYVEPEPTIQELQEQIKELQRQIISLQNERS